MRTIKHLSFPGLVLPVAALIALTGCPSPKYTGKDLTAHPSPIMVADGSMIVRTNSTNPSPVFAGTTLTIKGGLACAIIVNGVSKSVKNQNWAITSKDLDGTISTSDQGVTVVATSTVASAASLLTDLIDGPGAEFQVTFAPATFSIGGVNQPTLKCAAKCCRIKIDYESSCP
jgi:hypothetical protein